ncbi:MAG: BatA domain-containing protein [Bacteroidales bacterium]|nr:BatA domain-containing protein [Bacteroidales bacterium]
MNFLYPHFLWFLSLISIPIIIHLIQLRKYKTIYFSNNKLLNEALKQAKAKSKLRNLVLLLVRIFIIIFLVLVFSQPYKKNIISKNNNSSVITIYINNSFSMSNSGKGSSLIEEAKSKAISLINSLPKNYKYYVIENCDYNAYPFTFEEAIEKINNIRICSESKNLSEILYTSAKILNSKTIAIFTDGHKKDFDYSNFPADTLNIWLFYIKPQLSNNISVDTCYFINPSHIKGNTDVFHVKVTNHSDKIANKVPVRVYLDDTLKIIKSINIEPLSSKTLQFNILNIKKGYVKYKVEILDFPITYDNLYYCSYFITDKIPICLITESVSKFLIAFFASDSSFNYSILNPKNINLFELKKYNFIIIDKIPNITTDFLLNIKKIVQEGKTLLLFLPEKKENAKLICNFFGVDIISNDTSKMLLQIPSFKMEFYKGMFTKAESNIKMPWTRNCYTLTPLYSTTDFESIINYENNQSAFIKTTINKGNMYILGIPAAEQYSNFFEHPLFVSIIHKIAQTSVSDYNFTYFISRNMKINIPIDTLSNDATLEMTNLATKKSFIPFIKRYPDKVELLPDISLLTEGFYEVVDKASNNPIIALNYLRNESMLTYYNESELYEIIKSKNNYNVTFFAPENVDEGNEYIANKIKDKPLWRYFLIAALLMIICEIAIVLYWKI